MSRPPVTFHVLDTASGVPAEGMLVELNSNCNERGCEEPFQWRRVGQCSTNSDGRGSGLLPAHWKSMPVGVYMMKFHSKDYFSSRGVMTFYPYVEVVFEITDPKDHYHIPLLLSPFGYSTYRGS